MESNVAEVKVPIRLTTRDAEIQLEEDPGTLLVQTSKWLKKFWMGGACACTLHTAHLPGLGVFGWYTDEE